MIKIHLARNSLITGLHVENAMPNLSDILLKKDEIIELSIQFGFKDKVQLFYENIFPNPDKPKALNLVVEIDNNAQGNPNYANLLEAKLIEKFMVDVTVLVKSRINDPLHQQVVNSGSIDLANPVKNIRKDFSKIHWQEKDDIELEAVEKLSATLNRRLKLADKVLSDREKQALSSNMQQTEQNLSVSTSVSSFFHPLDTKNRKRKAATDIVKNSNSLSPEKQRRLEEILEDMLSDEKVFKKIEDLFSSAADTSVNFPSEPLARVK